MDSASESYALLCVVSSSDGDASFVHMKDGQSISAFKIKASNLLDILVHNLYLC